MSPSNDTLSQRTWVQLALYIMLMINCTWSDYKMAALEKRVQQLEQKAAP